MRLNAAGDDMVPDPRIVCGKIALLYYHVVADTLVENHSAIPRMAILVGASTFSRHK